MIFSIVYSYSDGEDKVTFRKRANVRASCPDAAKEKVVNFFLSSHDPNPTFRIESVKELFSVNYLII